MVTVALTIILSHSVSVAKTNDTVKTFNDNAMRNRVAAGKLSISITVVGDFGTTFCSLAFRTEDKERR
jgi:predicted Rossmann-fold nucleotide-binding protein